MSTFGWCSTNQHDKCKREYERIYFDAKGKIVHTEEMVKCECKKRGCKCYVKRADRTKTTNRSRRKT